MAAYIVRRVFWTVPVILLVILLTFVLMRQIEGNPFRKTERAVPASVQTNLERKFNLDKPWYVQYARYVEGVFTFDLGPSLVLRDRLKQNSCKTEFAGPILCPAARTKLGQDISERAHRASRGPRSERGRFSDGRRTIGGSRGPPPAGPAGR